ncbi:MAG: SDR family oxidoreductase [Deltaproteobacteria bacterium]|nr:SDR family oxidoreductase [Candidatus Zymogenaceae bacterium]
MKKVVFVTGGSKGIGGAIACEFASRGADVAIFARGQKDLDSALARLQDIKILDDQKFAAFRMDVTDPKSVDSSIADAIKELEVPDVLVNNAGLARPRYFEDITIEQFDRTIRTNLCGVWYVTSSVVPHMKERGGYIVNVSSLAGFMGVFGYSDYAASKFGVMGLTLSLRSELKSHGITVSALCPPDTDTPGFEEENKEKPVETKALSENAKVMDAQDVARSLISGMRRKKPVIITGFDGNMIYLANRVFPRLVEFIMDMTIRKVQKKKEAHLTG